MSGEGRWLAVEIGSELEQWRALQVAVPYAMKAADAETLGGVPLSAFVLPLTKGTECTQLDHHGRFELPFRGGPASSSGPIPFSSPGAGLQNRVSVEST